MHVIGGIRLVVVELGFVHKLVGINNADNAGGHTNAKHDAKGFIPEIGTIMAEVIERAENKAELDGKPDPSQKDAQPEALHSSTNSLFR